MSSKVIDIHEAEANFAALLDQVSAGEELLIGKHGKPVAKLVAFQPPKAPRVGGALAGKGWEAPDCWDPDPELEALFYDGPIFPPESEDLTPDLAELPTKPSPEQ